MKSSSFSQVLLEYLGFATLGNMVWFAFSGRTRSTVVYCRIAEPVRMWQLGRRARTELAP